MLELGLENFARLQPRLSLSKAGNRFIIGRRPEFRRIQRLHHPDPDETDFFPLIDGKTDKSQSFAFMSEHPTLFYLKAELMSAQQFGKSPGYEKWHRRLGHTSDKHIQDTSM